MKVGKLEMGKLEAERRGSIESSGEDFIAGSSDQQSVFELSRSLSVRGGLSNLKASAYHGPLVGPEFDLTGALVDHGLDGEDVSGLHDTISLSACIVWDGRVAVEKLADTVASVVFDDAHAAR